MIYLTQLRLNPASRMVQRELSNPYQLHRTLLQAFGTDRQSAGMLHRVEHGRRGRQVRVLVQSMQPGDWSQLAAAGQGDYLIQPPQSKEFDLEMPAGRLLRFRLCANPSKKVRRPDRKHSARVELYRDVEQLAWLRRKGELHGFDVKRATVDGGQRHRDWIGNRASAERHRLTVYTVHFDGVLQVTDSERFNDAWRRGIGPARAFGCGLLALAPV